MKEKLAELRGFTGVRLELHKQIRKRKQTGGSGSSELGSVGVWRRGKYKT